MLILIHLVGMNMLGALERRGVEAADDEEFAATRRRFFLYRMLLRVATLGSATILGLWLTRSLG